MSIELPLYCGIFTMIIIFIFSVNVSWVSFICFLGRVSSVRKTVNNPPSQCNLVNGDAFLLYQCESHTQYYLYISFNI